MKNNRKSNLVILVIVAAIAFFVGRLTNVSPVYAMQKAMDGGSDLCRSVTQTVVSTFGPTETDSSTTKPTTTQPAPTSTPAASTTPGTSTTPVVKTEIPNTSTTPVVKTPASTENCDHANPGTAKCTGNSHAPKFTATPGQGEVGNSDTTDKKGNGKNK